MTVTLFGIKNCDTIKKARKWLDINGIDYNFHDFQVDGIDKKLINTWLTQVEWQALLNTRGTTWRKLPEKQREEINKTRAIKLMLENAAIIKRPVLSVKNKIHIGFKEDNFLEIFS
jgi:arsenate reductase (glutaredoxin)